MSLLARGPQGAGRGVSDPQKGQNGEKVREREDYPLYSPGVGRF